ncbi:hypothetical protein ACJQWK_01933 [Exserohilum turcicum]
MRTRSIVQCHEAFVCSLAFPPPPQTSRPASTKVPPPFFPRLAGKRGERLQTGGRHGPRQDAGAVDLAARDKFIGTANLQPQPQPQPQTTNNNKSQRVPTQGLVESWCRLDFFYLEI